jgi:transcriptional regulator with XRE-family HTH domain
MITGRQIQAARALLGWSQQELADRARISINALYRLENGLVDPRISTVEAVRLAFERAGLEFFSDRDSEGLRLKRPRSAGREPTVTRAPKKR